MNDTTEDSKVTQFEIPIKLLLSTLPCLLCLYVNGVMLFALFRKPLLLETSRYILFGHLLLTESLQIVMTLLLYVFALTIVRMISYVCIVLSLLTTATVNITPLNLAVMSLERYVAVCFPLRHADITTTRRTGVAVAVIWTVASFDSITQLFLFISLENTSFILPTYCHRKAVLRLPIYSAVNNSFTTLNFLLVSMIIIYTYIAIIISVKSASSKIKNTSKAHKTVLLHLIQLCLCLASTLFHMISSRDTWNVNLVIYAEIQYILFIGLIIFPRCLSPLIYGLRDQTLRPVLKSYFTFGLKTTVKQFSDT